MFLINLFYHFLFFHKLNQLFKTNTNLTGICKYWFQVGLAPSAVVVLRRSPWNVISINGRTATSSKGISSLLTHASFLTGTSKALPMLTIICKIIIIILFLECESFFLYIKF